MKITHVLETHIHADYLSRACALSHATKAKHMLPKNKRVNYPYTPIHDRDKLPIGNLTMEAITTPGHTSESACYLIEDEALLSGDTLFIESLGRPDLEKGDAAAEAGARMLFHSLHNRILKLPDQVNIYPAHYGIPFGFDGLPLHATLGKLKSQINLLKVNQEAFVQSILSSLQAKPPNFLKVIAVNEGKSELGMLDPLELEAGPNRCAVR